MGMVSNDVCVCLLEATPTNSFVPSIEINLEQKIGDTFTASVYVVNMHRGSVKFHCLATPTIV
jgi:hypothetical protein